MSDGFHWCIGDDVDQGLGLERADVESCFGSFGGANVGSLGVHVPHGGCFGVGSVLLDLFHSEFGPGGEVAGAYGIDPSGEDW